MTPPPVYFMISVLGLCGLWLLWSYGLRRLFLDGLRERLFKLRFDLFELGMSNELAFDSDAYRSLEILLNGLLRFAHRFTLMTYIFSVKEQIREQREDKNYVDFSKELELKISRLPHDVQIKVTNILQQVQTAVLVYLFGGSLVAFILAFVVFVLRRSHIMRVSSTREVSAVIEREAYKEEFMRAHPAAA